MAQAHELFGQTLRTVVGQAFEAAGYTLQDNAMHQSRGLFRYYKPLADNITAYVEFQLLQYGGGPSRFRINLLRNTGADARSVTQYVDKVDTTLSSVLWNLFSVSALGGPDHWWAFANQNQLAYALLDAGKLLFAFGIPWLEGTLKADEEQ